MQSRQLANFLSLHEFAEHVGSGFVLISGRLHVVASVSENLHFPLAAHNRLLGPFEGLIDALRLIFNVSEKLLLLFKLVTRSLKLSLVFVFLIGHQFAILLKFFLLLLGGLDVDLCVFDLAFQILLLIDKRTHLVLQLLLFSTKSGRLVAHLKLLFFPDVLFLELDSF